MKHLHPDSIDEKGLSNWVMTSLREAILNGHFEPGEKLDQNQIAVDLEVSRTPVREALKVLETEGFVEILPYHGAYIPKICKKDIQDVFEVRWVIEPEITRQAVAVIPDNVLEHLAVVLSQTGFSTTNGGDRRFYDVDQEFHGTLTKYCQNKLFKEILDKMNNRIVRVRRFALRQPGDHLNKSQEEHNAVLAAICKRDPKESARQMERHLKDSARRIMKYISE